ncbi:MAG: hypothetical protein ABIH69_03195 [bacterium]
MPKKAIRKGTLGFKYERKRIKRDKKLPVLCPDYEAGNTDSCKKAYYCKNATHGWKNEAFGSCYGGTKSSELEYRKKRILEANHA